MIDNKTTEEKVKWLIFFFSDYPLDKKIIFSQKTKEEIDELYYQYKSHCLIHNLKITNEDAKTN